jgi:hypothetical protein
MGKTLDEFGLHWIAAITYDDGRRPGVTIGAPRCASLGDDDIDLGLNQRRDHLVGAFSRAVRLSRLYNNVSSFNVTALLKSLLKGIQERRRSVGLA